MQVSNILVPDQKVVLRVQEEEPDVGHKEDRVLVGENVRVRSVRALSHMLVQDTPQEQRAVKTMDRDKNQANWQLRLGCIVTSCEAYHNS